MANSWTKTMQAPGVSLAIGEIPSQCQVLDRSTRKWAKTLLEGAVWSNQSLPCLKRCTWAGVTDRGLLGLSLRNPSQTTINTNDRWGSGRAASQCLLFSLPSALLASICSGDMATAVLGDTKMPARFRAGWEVISPRVFSWVRGSLVSTPSSRLLFCLIGQNCPFLV